MASAFWLRISTGVALVFLTVNTVAAFIRGVSDGWTTSSALSFAFSTFALTTSFWCVVFQAMTEHMKRKFSEALDEMAHAAPGVVQMILDHMKDRGVIPPEVEIRVAEEDENRPKSKLN